MLPGYIGNTALLATFVGALAAVIGIAAAWTVATRDFPLATRVYELASDERLAGASTAALAIVALGVLPAVLLGAAVWRQR